MAAAFVRLSDFLASPGLAEYRVYIPPLARPAASVEEVLGLYQTRSEILIKDAGGARGRDGVPIGVAFVVAKSTYLDTYGQPQVKLFPRKMKGASRRVGAVEVQTRYQSMQSLIDRGQVLVDVPDSADLPLREV